VQWFGLTIVLLIDLVSYVWFLLFERFNFWICRCSFFQTFAQCNPDSGLVYQEPICVPSHAISNASSQFSMRVKKVLCIYWLTARFVFSFRGIYLFIAILFLNWFLICRH
jgi:hypothetical protein